jgi:hypothetical protein
MHNAAAGHVERSETEPVEAKRGGKYGIPEAVLKNGSIAPVPSLNHLRESTLAQRPRTRAVYNYFLKIALPIAAGDEAVTRASLWYT